MLLIMKLNLFFLIISVVQLSASNVLSQNKTISIAMQNATVRDVIKEIERQGQVNFFYNENLSELDVKVTVFKKEKPMEEILQSTLAQANMTYQEIKENFVVLVPNKEAPKEQKQTDEVTGQVIDASTGESLPGVNIFIESTTTGTISDIQGNYKISIGPKAKVLVYSYIGYITQRITIGDQRTINIELHADLKELDEVVVIGYGSMRRADLTGSVASISGEQLAAIPVANVTEALTGKMAGVQINTTDGSPDADIVIRIRGGGSVTQDNSPLFIVDGFPVDNINDISPNDIENIDVLKDASSAAIYGARGANGVILITTKSAEPGKTTVSYNGYVQARTLPKRLEVLSPYEYVLAQYEYAKVQRGDVAFNSFTNNFGVYEDLELYKGQRGTDWQDELLGDPTFSQNHNLSVTGGSEKTNYNFSFSNNQDDGILIGNGYDRTNLNFRLNHKLTELVSLDLSARMINTSVLGAGTSGSSNLRIANLLEARPVNGLMDAFEVDPNDPDAFDDYQSFIESLINPLQLVEQDYRKKENQTFYLNAGLSWSILDNLIYRGEYGINYYYGENARYYGPLTSTSRNVGSNLPLGAISKDKGDQFRLTNTMTYNFKLPEAHNLSLMVGQEMIGKTNESSYIRAKYFSESLNPEKLLANMALGTYDQMSTYISPEEKLTSFFGRANYLLKNRYIFSFTVRADGSSKFAPGNRWGVFPSTAFAWRISDEGFMQTQDLLSNLKLRISTGEAGNNRIPNDLWKRTYRISDSTPIGFGNQPQPYYVPATTLLSNPDLRWETTLTRNLGLDFGFKNRVSGSVELYHNTTKDLLVESDVPSYLGYSKQMRNIGQTSNKGVEFTIDARVIQKRNFTFSASFNIGFNTPKIDKLDGVNEKRFISDWATSDLRESDDYRLIVGKTVGLMYGYVLDGFYTVDDFASYNAEGNEYILKEGVPDATGILGGVIGVRPGVMKLKDIDGDGIITAENDRQIIGNATPKHTGGLNLSSRYKSWDLSLFFNWVYGNDIYNTGNIQFNMLYRTTYGNMLEGMNYDNRYKYIDKATGEIVYELDQLAELNKDAKIWSPFSSGTSKPLFHSGAIEDGSFLRLNTVTLGYYLPRSLISKLTLEQFRIYFTVYNAWIWTNYTGYDPEVSTTQGNSYRQLTPGVDYSAYPKSRSFTLGVNITF